MSFSFLMTTCVFSALDPLPTSLTQVTIKTSDLVCCNFSSFLPYYTPAVKTIQSIWLSLLTRMAVWGLVGWDSGSATTWSSIPAITIAFQKYSSFNSLKKSQVYSIRSEL